MTNKRQQERYKLTLIDTHTKLVFANDVRILDMSLSGVSLKADRRMNIGCNYTITIKDEGRVLNIKGKVIWSLLSGYKGNTRGENIPIYTAGMNFTDISIEKQKEIEDFIEKHRGTDFTEECRKEIDKPLDLYILNDVPLNISIKNPEDYILNKNFYRAKKLSLTGMMIECRKALEIESRLNMEITFPEGISINVKGYVASCCMIKNKNSEHYNIGIEFIDMYEKESELLRSFMFFYNPTTR